jgi:hypothetical protein
MIKQKKIFIYNVELYYSVGLLVSSLWIPMVIGLIVALWGFTNAYVQKYCMYNGCISTPSKTSLSLLDKYAAPINSKWLANI